MGDYFDKEEEEEQGEEEQEEGEDEEPEKKIKKKKIDDPLKYTDVKDIVRVRNEIKYEITVMKKEYKDNIGRLQLYLFGDPQDRKEYASQLDKLEEEADHPMTRGHPMAPIARECVRLMREIQLLYRKLLTTYENYIGTIGELLDDSIRLYMKDYKEWVRVKDKVVEATKEERTSAPPVTEGMVRDFMMAYGNKFIEKYNEGFDKESYDMVKYYRDKFVKEGTAFFANYNQNPLKFSELLLDKYAKVPWETARKLYKKKGQFTGKLSRVEPNPPQPLPLKESEGVSNTPDTANTKELEPKTEESSTEVKKEEDSTEGKKE